MEPSIRLLSSSPNGPDLVKRYEASGKPTINTVCRIIHYPVRLKARVLGTSLKLNLIVCHANCGLYCSCAHSPEKEKEDISLTGSRGQETNSITSVRFAPIYQGRNLGSA